MPTLPAGERLSFQNTLGVVTDRRLILTNGRSQRDIPLRSIASIEDSSFRHPIIALLFAVIGVALLTRGPVMIIPAALLFLLAIFVFIGSKSVAISIASGDKITLPTSRFRSKDAASFTDAARHQLVLAGSPLID